MIVDDAPAFGEALPNQGEDPADIAANRFFARQVPVAQHERGIVADEAEFKIGEIELAHGGVVGVDLFVSRPHGFEAALDAACS